MKTWRQCDWHDRYGANRKQIGLLLNIVPDAKTIGIMYNNGEANSKIQADLAEKELKKRASKSKY